MCGARYWIWFLNVPALTQVGGEGNVLYLIADDMHGTYKQARTPNLDALAKDSLVFERAFCAVAFCAPARAAVLTGHWPDTTRIYSEQFQLKRATHLMPLPHVFRAQGYNCHGAGKTFHHVTATIRVSVPGLLHTFLVVQSQPLSLGSFSWRPLCTRLDDAIFLPTTRR